MFTDRERTGETHMSIRRWMVGVVLGVLVQGAWADGKRLPPVELAGSERVVTSTVEPGAYRVELKYAMPGAEYRLEVTREVQPRRLGPVLPNPQGGNALVGGACQGAIAARRTALLAARDEAEVKAIVDGLDTALQGICPDARREQAVRDAEMDTTRFLPQRITIGRDEVVTVKIDRVGTDGATVAVHTVRYEALREPSGTWTTLFGFNFSRDHDRRYYTRAQTDSSGAVAGYQIARYRDNGGYVLSPSIYFMYVPARQDWFLSGSGKYYHGPMAGLGFDQSNANVFLGYGFGWGDNVVVTLGGMVRKETRLSGKYREGETVGEPLGDELVESTYAPSLYFGVAFRFGSNPFKTGQGE